jgi:hypothetical protein
MKGMPEYECRWENVCRAGHCCNPSRGEAQATPFDPGCTAFQLLRVSPLA